MDVQQHRTHIPWQQSFESHAAYGCIKKEPELKLVSSYFDGARSEPSSALMYLKPTLSVERVLGWGEGGWWWWWAAEEWSKAKWEDVCKGACTWM